MGCETCEEGRHYGEAGCGIEGGTGFIKTCFCACCVCVSHGGRSLSRTNPAVGSEVKISACPPCGGVSGREAGHACTRTVSVSLVGKHSNVEAVCDSGWKWAC